MRLLCWVFDAFEEGSARDDVSRRDWISLVAVHSDSWLLSLAFYLGIRLNHNERYYLNYFDGDAYIL